MEPTPTERAATPNARRERATSVSGDWFEQYKEDASVGTPADMMFRFVSTAEKTTSISGEYFAQHELEDDLRHFNFGNL